MADSIAVVSTWEEFRNKWDSRQNFILRGEVFPFQIDAPALEPVIEALRRNEQTRILHGTSDRTIKIMNEHYPEFRGLPMEQARFAKAALAHFELRDFAGPGQVFEGLGEIFDQWYASLASHGFTFTNSQRAIFYSGPQCNTGYHFDSSYVLAWQLVGTKRFCWLKEPERWCGHDVLFEQADRYEIMAEPPGITPDDVIECEMQPGDVLWNVMLTPHWVLAPGDSTYSINLTHFQLHCDGRASAIELEHDQICRDRVALAA